MNLATVAKDSADFPRNVKGAEPSGTALKAQVVYLYFLCEKFPGEKKEDSGKSSMPLEAIDTDKISESDLPATRAYRFLCRGP